MNLDIAESMLGSDTNTIRQELYGEAQSSTSYMFQPFMKRFAEKPLYRFKDKVQVQHSFIDPSGGGDSSDFTIATHAVEDGQYVLTGISAHVSTGTGSDTQKLRVMFQRHFQDIFDIPQYKSCIIYVYYEANDKIGAQIWAEQIQAMFSPERVHIFKGVSKQPGQPGVMTTEQDKIIWTLSMQEVLASNALHYAEHFISNDIPGSRDPTIKERFVDQCNRYTKDIEIAKDQFSKAKVTYGAKKGGLKDDIVTAVVGSIRHHKSRIIEPSYIKWCVQNNIMRF